MFSRVLYTVLVIMVPQFCGDETVVCSRDVTAGVGNAASDLTTDVLKVQHSRLGPLVTLRQGRKVQSQGGTRKANSIISVDCNGGIAYGGSALGIIVAVRRVLTRHKRSEKLQPKRCKRLRTVLVEIASSASDR